MTIDYSKAKRNAIFCQEVYQNFSSIIFNGIPGKPILISNDRTDTQCAILLEDTAATIIFRGSESSHDWETNLNTPQEQAVFDQRVIRDTIVDRDNREQVYPYAGSSQSAATMHSGFISAYFSVRDRIQEVIQSHELSSVTTTGHSLGGALATLCAVDIQYNFGDRLQQIEVYTYGAPKVGNNGFRESYNRRVPRSYRFVNGMDIVPALPRPWQGNYRHVEQEVRLGQRFSWNFVSERFKDHAIARYIDELANLIR